MIWPHCSTPDVALRAVAVDVPAFISVDSRQADGPPLDLRRASWLVFPAMPDASSWGVSSAVGQAVPESVLVAVGVDIHVWPAVHVGLLVVARHVVGRGTNAVLIHGDRV